MSLIDTIKRIVNDQVHAMQPAAVMYGVVTKENPLEVNVDQRLPLTADFLILPEHMTAYSVTVGVQTIEIRRGLELGDRVILLRSAGGRDYVVLGRLP
jgi:hypothetical protein